MHLKLIMLLVIVASPLVHSAGKITGIGFSGPKDGSHPNIVQISIEGGFSGEHNAAGCNPTLAAVRVGKAMETQHLVSYLLAANATGESVGVILDPTDRYWGDRCTITTVFKIN
jgi:hypothetical protein